ncbi:aryl-sulfate sulfotransferase [Campylobacter suis]|uniref:Arylsulfate sulfotransferase AssT n=1 Tax=Campylobacter suis TaxID=2790657 RepID=A0ABN7K928_9BACT|nr:aryl-sulfate sulfotransferase [Campylobacter suis]CAD7289048.1 Arylsulfate sulfotransferase AssT [Campylobacter suis]
MKNGLISVAVASALLLGMGTTNALAVGGASGPVSYKSVGKLGAVVVNPYKLAPLTAVIKNGGYDITDAKITVKAKGDKGLDIKYDVSDKQILTHGGIPVWGLYPDHVNKVEVSYKRNGEAISETYDIYAAPVFMNSTGTSQKSLLPKANIVKMDAKFKDRLYFINHLIRASLPDSGQAVWNHPVGGAMEWDLEPFNYIVDTNGDVRWYMKMDVVRNPDDIYRKGNTMGFQQTKDGHLIVGMGQRYMKFDMMGKMVFDRRLPHGYIDFSHHIEETPKGYLMRVASADQKRTDGKNVRTVRDVLLEVDHNGNVIDEWKLYNILDPYRDVNLLALDQGAVCLNVDSSKAGQTANKEDLEDANAPFGDVAGVGIGRNWAHVNSVNYDPSDDSIVVSVRHQSAVVKIGRDKQVKWILAARAGWNENLAKKLLTPVDKNGKKLDCNENGICENTDFDFTWTQHTAYKIDEKSSKGKYALSVFDNGDARHNEQPAIASMKYSRGVEYLIDEKNMTVQQVWEYGKERGFDWYSPITSVVEYQPDHDSMFIYSATAGLGKQLTKAGLEEPILNEIAYGTKDVKVEIKFTDMGGTIGYRALPIRLDQAFSK